MSDISQDNEFLARLQDPTKRIELWQWLNSASLYNSFTPCGMFPGAFVPHLTPSGTAQGADQSQPSSSGSQLACFPPMWWPPFPPFFAPQQVAPSGRPITSLPAPMTQPRRAKQTKRMKKTKMDIRLGLKRMIT